MRQNALPEVGAVVFDLDGTLIDSRADIAAAVNEALRSHGRPALGDSVIIGFVGDGARWLIARATNLAFDDPAVQPVLDTFLRYYTEHAVDRTVLMPGAADALRSLSGVPLAVCTNKPRATTDAVLRQLGIAEAFTVVVAGGDLPFQKPDPEPLVLIATRLGVAPDSLVVIGDGTQDIESAHAVGARSIAVTAGFTPRAKLDAARPWALVDNLQQAADVVRRLTRRANGTPR